jgi:hypothetical protein
MLSCLFDLLDCPRNNCFENWSSRVMKEMDLIYNDQLDKVDVRSFTTFSGNDIPFFWRCNNYVCFFYLLLRQMNITRQLFDFYSKRSQSCLKVSNDLSNQCLHRCDVDNLELPQVVGNLAVFLGSHLSQELKARKHSDVRLSSSCWSTDKKIFRCLKRSMV